MTQDEQLQRAWLALCGWQVGMVEEAGCVFTGQCSAEGWKAGPARPALDSPANWGHWLVQLGVGAGGAVLELDGDEVDGGPHAVARVGDGPEYGAHPAAALMAAKCLHAERHEYSDTLPPEVLDWWQHEQEESDG